MAIRSKVVLDTRFLFALYNPTSKAQEAWCKSLVYDAGKYRRTESTPYFASCISIAELYENMGRLVGKDTVRLRIASLANAGIEFIPVDEEISELAGDLKLNLGELPLADAIIASTALLHAGARLISDDEHFQKIKKLKLVWVDS